MTDDDHTGLGPIPIGMQRVMISVELGVIRELIAAHAFTPDALQALNHRLALPPGPITPAAAAMTPLRDVTLAELHAALIAEIGMDLAYWQHPHRPDIPDDASGINDPE